MAEITVQNIVASIKFADKLDLDIIAQSFAHVEYEPEQFPGLIFRLHDPKTATLLFTSGNANCTGAKNVKELRRAVTIIAGNLRNLGIEIYEDKALKIIIQNIVATSSLDGELNLSEVAIGLGLENVEYEPEQFPGLVYRINEPKVVFLLFSSGKIVCVGAKEVDDISKAVNILSEKLTQAGFLR